MAMIRLLPAAGTRASLDISGPAGDWDTVIEAVEEGPHGNEITFAGTADAVRSFLDLDTVTGDIDTIIEAIELYTLGDDITVEILGDSGAAEGVVLEEDTDARTVVLHFEDAVSTIGDLETVIDTSALIRVKTAGTGATVLDAATDETAGAEPLASGVVVGFTVSGTDVEYHFSDGETTVADFEADLVAGDDVEGATEANALIKVKTAGTGAVTLDVTADDFTATNLTGGGATTSAAPTVTDGTLGLPMKMLCDEAKFFLVSVDSVSGTTKTAAGTLWAWHEAMGYWFAVGAVNGGSNIAEVATDLLAYCELITGLRNFTRLYFQIASLGGAGTEVAVYMDLVPADTATT